MTSDLFEPTNARRNATGSRQPGNKGKTRNGPLLITDVMRTAWVAIAADNRRHSLPDRRFVTPSAENLIIVGAGLAGFNVASELGRMGYRGRITLVGDEPEAPYDRPPLSKEYLADGEESRLALAPALPADVQHLQGVKVDAIDPAQRLCRLSNGAVRAWDKLVIATGARPRELPHLKHSSRVLTLRTLADARLLRASLQGARNLVVIGGGPIGLELAASARGLGVQAAVVELGSRLMSRSVPAAMAQLILEHHQRQGLDIRLGRSVASIDDASRTVCLDNGALLPADVVVVGIGVSACDELAVNAGLRCDDGIFVDAFCRTSAEHIFAVGDVCRQVHPITGRTERIETWSNAQGQAVSLARYLIDSTAAAPFSLVPWFWSDQGDLRLQCAGVAQGEQEVWMHDDKGRVLVYLSGGSITGVAVLNAPRTFSQLKKIVGVQATLSPEELTARDVDIRSIQQRVLASRTPT